MDLVNIASMTKKELNRVMFGSDEDEELEESGGDGAGGGHLNAFIQRRLNEIALEKQRRHGIIDDDDADTDPKKRVTKKRTLTDSTDSKASSRHAAVHKSQKDDDDDDSDDDEPISMKKSSSASSSGTSTLAKSSRRSLADDDDDDDDDKISIPRRSGSLEAALAKKRRARSLNDDSYEGEDKGNESKPTLAKMLSSIKDKEYAKYKEELRGATTTSEKYNIQAKFQKIIKEKSETQKKLFAEAEAKSKAETEAKAKAQAKAQAQAQAKAKAKATAEAETEAKAQAKSRQATAEKKQAGAAAAAAAAAASDESFEYSFNTIAKLRCKTLEIVNAVSTLFEEDTSLEAGRRMLGMIPLIFKLYTCLPNLEMNTASGTSPRSIQYMQEMSKEYTQHARKEITTFIKSKHEANPCLHHHLSEIAIKQFKLYALRFRLLAKLYNRVLQKANKPLFEKLKNKNSKTQETAYSDDDYQKSKDICTDETVRSTIREIALNRRQLLQFAIEIFYLVLCDCIKPINQQYKMAKQKQVDGLMRDLAETAELKRDFGGSLALLNMLKTFQAVIEKNQIPRKYDMPV